MRTIRSYTIPLLPNVATTLPRGWSLVRLSLDERDESQPRVELLLEVRDEVPEEVCGFTMVQTDGVVPEDASYLGTVDVLHCPVHVYRRRTAPIEDRLVRLDDRMRRLERMR